MAAKSKKLTQSNQAIPSDIPVRSRRLRILIRGGSVKLNTDGLLIDFSEEFRPLFKGHSIAASVSLYPDLHSQIQQVVVRKKNQLPVAYQLNSDDVSFTLSLWRDSAPSVITTITLTPIEVADGFITVADVTLAATASFGLEGLDPDLSTPPFLYRAEDSGATALDPLEVRRLVITVDSAPTTVDFGKGEMQSIFIS